DHLFLKQLDGKGDAEEQVVCPQRFPAVFVQTALSNQRFKAVAHRAPQVRPTWDAHNSAAWASVHGYSLSVQRCKPGRTPQETRPSGAAHRAPLEEIFLVGGE